MKLYVGLVLPPAIAAAFPPDAERGEPHVTLLYVPALRDDTPDAGPLAGRVIAALAETLDAAVPVPVALGPALTVLDSGEGATVAHALPLIGDARVRLLRVALRHALHARGIGDPQTFDDYRPHATVAYTPRGEAYAGLVPVGEGVAVAVQVTLDDMAATVPLGPGASEAMGLALSSVQPDAVSPEATARLFHETYERLAPDFNYKTRRQSAVAWEDVPSANKTLMVETARRVLVELRRRTLAARLTARLTAWRGGEDLYPEAARRAELVTPPPGHILAPPFRCLREGPVYCRETGESRLSRHITRDDIVAAVAAFDGGASMLIDREHATGEPGGRVVACWVVDDPEGAALAVLPAYGPELADYVRARRGNLWSSPVVRLTPWHHPRTGEQVGSAWCSSLALTTDPAQHNSVIDAVHLTAGMPPPVDENPTVVRGAAMAIPSDAYAPEEAGMTPEAIAAMKEQLAASTARIAELEAELALLRDEKAAAEEQAPPAPSVPVADMVALTAQFETQAKAVAKLEASLAAERASLEAERKGRYIERKMLAGELTPAVLKAVDILYANGGEASVELAYPKGQRLVPLPVGHGLAASPPDDNARQARLKTGADALKAKAPGLSYRKAIKQARNAMEET